MTTSASAFCTITMTHSWLDIRAGHERWNCCLENTIGRINANMYSDMWITVTHVKGLNQLDTPLSDS
jgi:hypothetical protein